MYPFLHITCNSLKHLSSFYHAVKLDVSQGDCAAPALTFPVPVMEHRLSLSSTVQLSLNQVALKESFQLLVAEATALLGDSAACINPLKAISENCPQMDSLPASPSPMLKGKRNLTINSASM